MIFSKAGVIAGLSLLGRGTRARLFSRIEASALPARLEGAKLWRSPALSGALQPDPRSGRDIFTMTAELATAPKQEARRAGH